jgi:hypothetical protein
MDPIHICVHTFHRLDYCRADVWESKTKRIVFITRPTCRLLRHNAFPHWFEVGQPCSKILLKGSGGKTCTTLSFRVTFPVHMKLTRAVYSYSNYCVLSVTESSSRLGYKKWELLLIALKSGRFRSNLFCLFFLHHLLSGKCTPWGIWHWFIITTSVFCWGIVHWRYLWRRDLVKLLVSRSV